MIHEMNYTCFRKPALKLLLQTDDRNVNIIETTENEPEGWYSPIRTENEADAIVTLPGTQ